MDKLSICKKESKETKYWLQIISHTYPNCINQARVLWKEAQEFNLIFAKIIHNSKSKE